MSDEAIITKAVIVAGGKGTRIRSISGDLIPKALVPVAGQPIIFRQFELLKKNSVEQIAIVCGHLASILEKEVDSVTEKLGIHLKCFREHKPLGTAGGLKLLREFIGTDDFFVLYGDMVIGMELQKLAAFHKSRKALATITAHPNDHPYESDLLVVDDNYVLEKILFRKDRKPGFYRNLVPAGVYAFSYGVIKHIKPDVPQDFIHDIFPRMLNKGERLFVYNTPEYLKDMGTVERYDAAESDIKRGVVEKALFTTRRKTIFLDRDGVINMEPGGKGVISPGALELLDGSAKAIRMLNEAGYLVVVVTNQPQIAKGFLTFDGLKTIHAKLETILGLEHAKLDGIYFCPHHPESGFEGEIPELKIKCRCRKPEPGMIEKALEELPVNLRESFMIGDSWRDIGAARAIGIHAIAVRTGFGCRKCIGRYRPDVSFGNLLEAVDYLMNGFPGSEEALQLVSKKLMKDKHHITVGISGMSRSGKSVLAFDLSRKLEVKGIKTLIVTLDDWILPVSKRWKGMTTEERLNVKSYTGILDAIGKKGIVEAPGYDPFTREAGPPETYSFKDIKVIILDGILALHPTIREKIDIALFTDTDPETVISRKKSFLRWKGDPEEAISAAIIDMMDEELKIVSTLRNNADLILGVPVHGERISE